MLFRLQFSVALLVCFGWLGGMANGQDGNVVKAKLASNSAPSNKQKVSGQTKNQRAQDDGKGPAYTSIPKGDLCFPLMGEFVGKAKNAEGAQEVLALQVRVIGKDKFDAIAYRGGLPGQSKFESEPTRMVGQRSDGFLILSGGPWAIFVEKNGCSVVGKKGELLGKLKRIKRSSPTLLSPPPEGAFVLFDGTSTKNFTTAEMTKDGLLMQGADVMPMFQDFDLHIEFKLPYMPQADSQKRSNSGLYLQSRYECQILDSFATTPVINGCGALYRFKAPDLNMSLPPLTWQTYDVRFTAPRWASDGSKVRNAHITSWVNGVKVQDNVSLPNKTGAGKTEEPILLPIKFQDHGDPVRFRNAWIVDRGLGTVEFPRHTTKEQRAAVAKAIQDKLKAERRKRAEALRLKKEKAAEKKRLADQELKKAEAELKKVEVPDEPEAKKKPRGKKPAKAAAKPEASKQPAQPAKKEKPQQNKVEEKKSKRSGKKKDQEKKDPAEV